MKYNNKFLMSIYLPLKSFIFILRRNRKYCYIITKNTELQILFRSLIIVYLLSLRKDFSLSVSFAVILHNYHTNKQEKTIESLQINERNIIFATCCET